MVSALKQHQVKTKRPSKKGTTPRLPHERDESDDSQESGARDDMKQAYDDLKQGQLDTDLRGERGITELNSHTPGQMPDSVAKNPNDKR